MHDRSARQRAWGTPGAQCTRSLVCKGGKHTSVVTTGPPEIPGAPARNGFNGFLRALPGDRLIVTVACGQDFVCPVGLAKFRQLDASAGASGPHDFAVRSTRLRQPPSSEGGLRRSRGFAGPNWAVRRNFSAGGMASLVCVPLVAHGKPALLPHARPMLPRPPHPTPRSVTIAIRPCVGQDGNGYRCDLG